MGSPGVSAQAGKGSPELVPANSTWLAQGAEPADLGIHPGGFIPGEAQLLGILEPALQLLSATSITSWAVSFPIEPISPAPGNGWQREGGIVSSPQQYEDSVGSHSVSRQTPTPDPGTDPDTDQPVGGHEGLRCTSAVPSTGLGRAVQQAGGWAALPMPSAGHTHVEARSQLQAGMWRH